MAKTIKKGAPVISSFGKQNNEEELGEIYDIRKSNTNLENKDLLDYRIRYLISGAISPWITNDGKSGDGSVQSISMEKFFVILKKDRDKITKEIELLKIKKAKIIGYLKENSIKILP